MKYIQVYENNSIVVFECESLPEFVGLDPRFINYPEGREDIVSGWYCVDGKFSPPSEPVQQYKTKALNQTEYRGLFTISETVANDECEAMINNSNYQLTGGIVGLDDLADLVGVPFATYRQLMRSAYAAFAKSTVSGVDMDNPTTVLSLNCQALLGLLDSPDRKDAILMGKPL